MAADPQVNNFITRVRQEAEIVLSATSGAISLVSEYQKLGYNPTIVDAEKAGENEDITGAEIDTAIAALNDLVTYYNTVAGTYLLRVRR